MKCGMLIELLSAYLDEELDKEQKAEVEKHLGECKFCRNELEELRQVDEHVRTVEIKEPSSKFVFNLNKQVMEKVRKKRRFSLFRFSPVFVPAAVALLIIIVLINVHEQGSAVSLDHRVLFEEIEMKKDVDIKMPKIIVVRRKTSTEKETSVTGKKALAAPSAPAVAKSEAMKMAERTAEAEVFGGMDRDEVTGALILDELGIPDDRVVRAIIDSTGTVVKVATGNSIVPEKDTMLENLLQGQQLSPPTVSGRRAQIFVDLTQMKEKED